MPLGDAWEVEPADPQPDEASPFALNYYRQKALEFQGTLNAIDTAYTAANAALSSGALDEASQAALLESLDEYESKRLTLKLTAEAINAAGAAINYLGGSFPAIGAAVALITWGVQWIGGVNERLRRAQLLSTARPEQRDALVRAIAESDNAVNQAQSSTLAAIAPALKWIAIAALGFLAYRAYTARK
jgi:hypothetical protein